MFCGASPFDFVRFLHFGLPVVGFGAPASWLSLSYTVWLVHTASATDESFATWK